MKLIVGLGNPGIKYKRTRHNAGFLIIDSLILQNKNKLVEGKGPYLINQKPFLNDEVLIAKPNLFMNESGRAVKILIDQFELQTQECLVVVDDVNLPLGTIRFRARGSAGGHHGLESIDEILGTEDFPRLRIGVGRGDPAQNLTDFVLGKFTEAEWKTLEPAILRARDACLEWAQEGAEAVMQRYNS